MTHAACERVPTQRLLLSLFFALALAACAVTSSPQAPEPTRPSSPCPTPPTPTPTIPRPGGRLGQLDELFVQSYEARQHETATNDSPVITVSGSELILYRDTHTENVPVIPDRYHTLKAIAHAPFTVYLSLSSLPDGATVPATVSERLQKITERLGEAQAILGAADLTSEERDRATQILNPTKDLLRQVSDNKQSDQTRLHAFARHVGPLLLANAWDAGCNQVRATHEQVMKWKRLMAPEEWSRLRVVNRGAHQARYANAATQYFAWLFNDHRASGPYPGESERVVYAEAIFGKQTARDVLATIAIDADASEAFFGDAHRLSEDILRDGAKDCIALLPVVDRNVPTGGSR